MRESDKSLGPITVGPITRTDIVRYQGASGDFHPAHHDDEYAQKYGFPKAFSLGLLHAGYACQALLQYAGPEDIRRVKFRFRGVGYPGDMMTVTGEVEDGPAPGLDTVKLSCVNQDGDPIVTGEAVVVHPKE